MASIKVLIEGAKKHFDSGETLIAAVSGTYETKILGKDSVRSGALISTNHRILFYGKKLGGYDLEVFPYSNISSIDVSKSIFMGYKITIFASGNKATLKWIASGEPENFVTQVRSRIGKKEAQSSNDDVYTQLEKLATLKEKKIISSIEYEQKRAQLLKRI